MKISELKNYQRILILGYGVEGRAVSEFLQKVHPSAIVGIADQNTDPDYLAKQKQYDLAIKSPGISKKKITIPYTTATNIFFANIQNQIIGVTGTKGKSTTASLIYDILKTAGKRAHLVGNIGKPAILYLLKEISKEDIFVMELSSYQLDDIQYSPHIAVFLTIFPDHMQYHSSFNDYFTAKSHIVTFSKNTDYFVYNPDDPKIGELTKSIRAQPAPFIQKIPFNIEKIKLLGMHNVDNIRAAVTVGHVLKIEDSIIEKAIVNFHPLPHRLQIVGTYHEITFIDDGAATTPESTIYSLNTIKNVDTLLIGGQDRGYDFSKLCKVIDELKIPNLVLFPDTGQTILVGLEKRAYSPNILKTSHMEEAVEFAFKQTRPGKTCLLSSASPSYSLWKSFVEKGQRYQDAIKGYDEKNSPEKNHNT